MFPIEKSKSITVNFARNSLLLCFVFAEKSIDPEITMIDKMLFNCENIKTSVINMLSAYTTETKKGEYHYLMFAVNVIDVFSSSKCG